MSTTVRVSARATLLAAMLILLIACNGVGPTIGPLRTELHNIKPAGATSARVELTLGAGELILSGGARDLVTTKFVYNIDHWKPMVNYDVTEQRGGLKISQGTATNAVIAPNTRNEWDVKLNSSIPLDLKLGLGAGSASVNFRGLNLDSAEITGGVGDLKLDLSGTWVRPVLINIAGGVGKLSLKLPRDFGFRVKTTTGVGRLTTSGLAKVGDVYVNPAQPESAGNVNVVILAGIGEISLEIE